MKVENWCGCDIQFVEINGEWRAILKDICDASKLQSKHAAERLDPSMLERVRVEASNTVSNNLRSRCENKT